MPLRTLQGSGPLNTATKGVSLEEAGWLEPRVRREVAIYVDDRFQDRYRAKLTRLFMLNPKTDPEMVDLSKLHLTLEKARTHSKDVAFIQGVYKQLKMEDYCPPLENRDGTYDVERLKDFKRIITKVSALLGQLSVKDVKLFFNSSRRAWNESLLDQALQASKHDNNTTDKASKRRRITPVRN